MDREFESVITNWESVSFDVGYAGLHELAESGFSGAITTGSAWGLMVNGQLIKIPAGSLNEFTDGPGTAYKAPYAALPLLFAMRTQKNEQRGKYSSGETPITEVDEMLSNEDFTGYIEFSEHVTSGEFYVVYENGESRTIGFLEDSEDILTGETAFERATWEVGIYEVYAADIEAIDIPGKGSDATNDDTAVMAEQAPTEPTDGGATTTTDKIIGIDFGTTNSAVAVMEGGEPTVIPTSDGDRRMPSVVVAEDDDQLVGTPAEERMIQNPATTVKSAKRQLGDPETAVNLGGTNELIESVAGRILTRIKQDAERYLDADVAKAVITVPTQFNKRQRQAVRRAGQKAGLEVERLIEDPAAAAMAYGFDDDADQTVLVFDLGGGSVSVGVIELGGGVCEVVGTGGDIELGGDDWDTAIRDHFADEFEATHGIDLRAEEQAKLRLTEAAKEAKHDLANREKTTIELPYITTTKEGSIDLESTLTRETVADLTEDLRHGLVEPIEAALESGSVSPEAIDSVVLVGAGTRMPHISEPLETVLGNTPIQSGNRDEAVALGAAIQGGILAGDVNDIVLLDTTPLSVGVALKGGGFEPLIKKDTTIPTSESKVFTPAADDQTAVEMSIFEGEAEIAAKNDFLDSLTMDGLSASGNDDQQIEVTFDTDENGVLNVAAQHKASGRCESVTITEPADPPSERPESTIVMPEKLGLSVGIEIDDGEFKRLASKGSEPPVAFSDTLTTDVDGQTAATVRIYRGEYDRAVDNEYLGEITLEELPAGPAGTPIIDIEGHVDAEKTIHLSAESQVSGSSDSITMEKGADPTVENPGSGSEGGGVGAGAGNQQGSTDTEGPTHQLTKFAAEPIGALKTFRQLLTIESSLSFDGTSVLLEALADGTAEFESGSELLDTLVDLAVDTSDKSEVLDTLVADCSAVDDTEGLKGLLDIVVSESDAKPHDDEIAESVIQRVIDVRNEVLRCQRYIETQEAAAAATADRRRTIADQLEDICRTISETISADPQLTRGPNGVLYRTLSALKATLAADELSSGDLSSCCGWIDTAVALAGYTVIAPAAGTTPDPYRHQVWATVESELPEGEIVHVEEVGYERDGELKREAKVVISEDTTAIPERIPSPPQLTVSYQELDRGDVIGRGGNADVYKATVQADDQQHQVALKEPRINDTIQTELIDSMAREAEMWQQLDSHDHIVSVVDYGKKPLPWIAIEYMNAGHLGERAGELPFTQAMWTALAITKAVRHAHEHGVVHLDLKPENILFTGMDDAWDVPKVADWGLSKQLLNHSEMTEGPSPHYAAPEQFDSEQFGSTDKATDVYQLGAVCYELFTGRPPFEGQTFEVINKIQSAEPTPPSQIADVPPEVDAILQTALATQKSDRFEHVLYFRDALQEIETIS